MRYQVVSLVDSFNLATFNQYIGKRNVHFNRILLSEVPKESIKDKFPAFESNLRDLANSKTIIFQSHVRPASLSNYKVSRRLNKYFEKKQSRLWTESNAEEMYADKINAGIIALRSCQTDGELLKVLSELFHSEGGIPPQKLLSEAIISLGRRGDYLGGFAVVEQVRRRGLLSYLDGCTTQVYNSLLESTWVNTRDPTRMIYLLDDMRQNSILFDAETRKIVSSATTYLHEKNQVRLRRELQKAFKLLEEAQQIEESK